MSSTNYLVESYNGHSNNQLEWVNT